jgi:hypothetical protein
MTSFPMNNRLNGLHNLSYPGTHLFCLNFYIIKMTSKYAISLCHRNNFWSAYLFILSIIYYIFMTYRATNVLDVILKNSLLKDHLSFITTSSNLLFYTYYLLFKTKHTDIFVFVCFQVHCDNKMFVIYIDK